MLIRRSRGEEDSGKGVEKKTENQKYTMISRHEFCLLLFLLNGESNQEDAGNSLCVLVSLVSCV